MNNYIFCNIRDSEETKDQAVKLLLDTFPKANMWPDLDEKMAIETVNESILEENICVGLKINNELIGWCCLTPSYWGKTWDLHPFVISTKFQGKGLGKKLMGEIEKLVQEKGAIGIILDSGDEEKLTSLSEKEINEANIFEEIKNIKNIRNHPYEFYKKCGFMIYGIIPNAYGVNKSSILMWKDIRKK
jgi:aminoglycoside 6'-N-acetyltransferase I